MAEIYLMHYRHGVKIATMELEAQYDEQNGWVRFDPDEMVADLPELTAEANVMAEAPRRRGRPRKDD
jgi:sugar (pentulose or hexulose) kinase